MSNSPWKRRWNEYRQRYPRVLPEELGGLPEGTARGDCQRGLPEGLVPLIDAITKPTDEMPGYREKVGKQRKNTADDRFLWGEWNIVDLVPDAQSILQSHPVLSGGESLKTGLRELIGHKRAEKERRSRSRSKAYVGRRSRSEAHVTYSNRGSGVLTDLGCRTVYESCMGLGRTLNVAFSSSWKELRSLMNIFSPSISLLATTVRLVGLDHLCRGQESAHSVRLSDSTCC